jgi:hypothetical protein
MSGRTVAPAPRSFEAAAPHHRRVRRASRRRLARHTPLLLLGVGAALITCVAGYTLGSLVLGGFGSSPPQSAAYGIPNAPTGVSFVQAELQFTNGTTSPATGSCTAANLGNLTAPTGLTSGVATPLCLSHSATGFAAGDAVYILQIQFNTTALNSTVFKVQVSIDVTPSANDISVTSYLKTSAAISSPEQATYGFDLIQSGDTAVNNFAVLVTQL